MENNNKMPKNRFGLMITFSILEILSCCLVNPITLILGMVSMILTCNANASYNNGKLDEFRNSAKKAAVLLWIGFAFDILVVIIWAVMLTGINKEIKNKGYDSIRDYYEAVLGRSAKSADDLSDDGEEDDDMEYTLADMDALGEYWKFSLDGNSFEVPFAFSKLIDAKYTFDDDDPSAIMLEGKECYSDSIYDADGEVLLGEIEVFNPSDEEQAESDCIVVSFTLYDDLAYDGDYEQEIALIGNLGFGSTMDEVRAALGEPSYIDDEYDDAIYDEWIFDDDFNNVFYVGYMDDKLVYFCVDYWGSYDPDEAFYGDDDEEWVLDDGDFIFEDDDIDTE